MWDLWWTDCLRDKFFSEYLCFPQLFSFHLCSVHVSHSSTTDAVILTIYRIFKYSMLLTDNGRCTCEIKSRIAMEKAAFNKKKNLFTSKLDLNLRKKLVKCYVWSMAVYGAETWTLQAT